MTNMQIQKKQALSNAIKDVKFLRHLTGNNERVAAAQTALEELKDLV